MDKEFYAHSKEGKPPSEWQQLEEHRLVMAIVVSQGKVI